MRFHLCLFFFWCAPFLAGAQTDYFLPFSLQASLGENAPVAGLAERCPATGSMYSVSRPCLAATAFGHSAFIKENGHYGISSSTSHGKNTWSLHYGFKGYSLLNKQEAGLGYGRNLLPGLGAGIFLAYQATNRIEGRTRGRWLEIGLSAAFKRGIWSVAFDARQPVTLLSSSSRTKEWNRALSLHLGTGCNLYKGLHLGLDLYKDLRYSLQGGLSLACLLRTSNKAENTFIVHVQAKIHPTAYEIGFAHAGRRIQTRISVAYQHPVGWETCIGITLKHLFPKNRADEK